jgi:hypothetical protein
VISLGRRSILKVLAASAGVLPIRPWQAWAQTVNFPGAQKPVLEALGLIVLPGSLGREGVLQQVSKFELWVQNYREGADTDHGYGRTRVIPLPASPAPAYLNQLEELQSALLSGDPDKARAAVLDILSRADIRDLTPLPRGKNIVSDLMSFYFHSSEANDLCYKAAIERYKCRGVEHSEAAPAALTKPS